MVGRIVFAPLTLKDPERSNRDFQYRPVTIERRADEDESPAKAYRRVKNYNK